MKKKGLLERLAAGPVPGDGGYLACQPDFTGLEEFPKPQRVAW